MSLGGGASPGDDDDDDAMAATDVETMRERERSQVFGWKVLGTFAGSGAHEVKRDEVMGGKQERPGKVERTHLQRERDRMKRIRKQVRSRQYHKSAFIKL